MTPLLATLGCFALYVVGYQVYARFLGERIFRLNNANLTPAHTMTDGVDYVPTNRFVLFGHHYASIAGLGPLLGPAVAVIWGWLPAMLWVVLGSILVGCVHDLSALVLSMRARGVSIGKLTEGIVGHRAKGLFLALIFFGIALAMGVFVYVLAVFFQAGPDFNPNDLAAAKTSYPSAVVPSAALILMALVMGHLLYIRKFPLGPVTAVGFVLMLIAVWVGTRYPTMGVDAKLWPKQGTWTWILLAYGFVASVLPVWSLLQARDFLNSLLLYLGLLATYAGFFLLSPKFAAPAINAHPEGAPPMYPFVFIVIACGAASGFHALVSSGTTSKQINRESDARFIAYGGMVGESILGLLAVLACTAGFESAPAWTAAYRDWGAIESGMANKLGAFVRGCSRFIETLGVDRGLAAGFVAVVVVSFALTTLDSATRLLRYNISEIGSALRIRVMQNRYVATALACVAIGFFAFYRVADPETGGTKAAGLVLWQLFGTTNQLLAGLALLVASVYLYQRRRNALFTGLPAVFMLISTLLALVEKLGAFYQRQQWLLLVVGAGLLVLAAGVVIESILAIRRGEHFTEDEVVLSAGG
ncbi:MAG: carbon starvation protein A [Phycisphaerae bacterium]|nr:carbon starvation protein A [Phycisphaerae bacterium]